MTEHPQSVTSSAKFAYPPDRIPGCLPRRSLPGARFPLAAEHIKLIPRADWAAMAKDISLRPFVKTVLDQDGVGSCATEATAGAAMLCRAFKGLPHVVLNPWSIYWYTSGGVDGGSSIDDNLAYARDYGIAPMDLWPRSKGWRAKPSAEALEAAKQYRIDEAYDITSVDEMVSALLTGFCVVYGASGHAVLKVQHINESQGLDLNSWGEDWGDNGFGVWSSYRGINWAYGAWAIRTTAEG